MTFVKEEQVRFRHVDLAGIVFYPRFLEMLNDLVEDWFAEALQSPFGKMHHHSGIPTVNLNMSFNKPARIGDVLFKRLQVVSVGTSSMECKFNFTNQSQDLILSGHVTLVNVGLDKENNQIKAVPFSSEIKARIEPFLIPPHGI